MPNRQRRSLADSPAACARAFRDAMRDILAEDGVFSMADGKNPSVVWAYDGLRWVQLLTEGARATRPEQTLPA